MIYQIDISALAQESYRSRALNNWAKDKAIVYVATELFKNKSLQSSYVDGNRNVGVEDFLCPI